MEFCDNCFNFLFTKEINEDNEKKIIYYCKKCNFKKECKNFLIFKKTYKKIKKGKDELYDNKLKVNDKTLPIIKIKCNHCKKINENKYQILYENNYYKKIIICINCFNYINK